jgi:diacylglycerol kinase (ATP)
LARRALFLVNRKCRFGLADVSKVVEILRDGGLELIVIPIEDPLEIAPSIRAHRHEVELVILGGGDGTMNAAAEALMDCALPMAILPMGTANDLARTLAIPTALPEAAHLVLTGSLHPIDIGCVNGKLFFNVASLGLPVEVSRWLTPEIKRRWGVFSYAISSWRALRHVRPFKAEVRCDGERRTISTIQISVGNGRHYGGGMTVDEHAAIDDGLLHLYSLRPRQLWHWILLLPALRSGRHKRLQGVLTMSGREITIHTRRPRAINTDGELTTWTPARFDVLPQALSVVVPNQYFSTRQGVTDDSARRVGSRPQ